jgi:thiaminase
MPWGGTMIWKDVFEETMRNLEVSAKSFCWENKEHYAQWLGQTYHFVVHSTRILALASARTPMKQFDLHQRFIDHAKEERGHEKLLISDLKCLGSSIEQIPEFSSTSALYKTQYYYIDHVSVSALMGWVAMLEGFAANFGPQILERVVKAHGASASHFLKVHSVEDQEHIQKAMVQIHQLPPELQADAIINFRYCAHYYQTMLSECSNVTLKQQKAA